MNKLEIRKECERLFKLRTIQDSYDLINIYLNYLIQVINNHHEDKVFSYADRDAKMVNQMMFTKVAHIKRIIEGITFQSKNGVQLNTIIDPTIVASLIRNVYETVGMFHLIYRRTKNEDEKTIIYDLWVHAGLMFRQRFENIITIAENREKFEDERKQLEQLKNEIQETGLFKELTEKNQNKILTKLKEKDYKILFNEKEVEFLSWQGIILLRIEYRLFLWLFGCLRLLLPTYPRVELHVGFSYSWYKCFYDNRTLVDKYYT